MFHLKDELVFPTWQLPVLLTVETKILFTSDFFSLSFLFHEQQIVPDDIVEEDSDQPNDKGAKSVQNLLNAIKLIIVYSYTDLIIVLSIM